jgi:hypothetical protein
MREVIERLRPSLGQDSDRIWALYLASEKEEQRELETTLRLLDLSRNRTAPGTGPPSLPPPEPGVLDGWLRLGDVRYPSIEPAPFGLDRSELIQHVGIFGRSGAGKTNTVMVLLQRFLEHRIPFLIFDWKRNYRDLLAAPWVPNGSVAAFTAGRDLAPIRLNPLRPPPGTEPRTWLKKLIEIMAHAYFLGEGVMYLLQEAIDSCYEQAGVYKGSQIFPTFHDVYRQLRARKATGREANWMASTLRTLSVLTFGPMAETVGAADSIDIGALLKMPAIIELDALSDSDKVFLVESLLLYIHHLRLQEPEREVLKHVLVVEEAHHVFLRSKQEVSSGEAITDVILREIRELGEGVVLVDQHPSQIAITALGNTFCTIAMNLKHRSDVTTVGDACLLEPEQKDHLGRLPVGHAVVKLQDRWPAPFMVSFPLVKISKGSVSDSRLRQLQVKAGKGSENQPGTVEPREIPPQIAPVSVIPAVPPPPKGAELVLTPEEIRLLEHVAREPAAGVTRRYADLNLSRRMGTTLKRGLAERGMLREVKVALPGGRITLLELTRQGWSALGEEPPGNRHGGSVHRYWMRRITRALQSDGYSVEEEVRVGTGKTIDLRAIKEGQVVAVEVEASGRRLRSSFEKLAAVPAGKRLLVCCDRATVDRARAICADSQTEPPIEIRHAWSFLGKNGKSNQ